MHAIEHGHRPGRTEEQAAQSPYAVLRWRVSTRCAPPTWVDMNQIALRIWSDSSRGVPTFIVERLSLSRVRRVVIVQRRMCEVAVRVQNLQCVRASHRVGSRAAVHGRCRAPRKQHGRPLVLRPLPAFGDVLDDREEFEQAVEAAVAGLVPRVRLTASRLDVGTAVLRQALAYYAQDGGSSLSGFVELLRDLPDDVSDFRGAAKLAADMAERLKAAAIVDRCSVARARRWIPVSCSLRRRGSEPASR
jgi:hypothetical protein